MATEPLADEPAEFEVTATEVIGEGSFLRLVRDTVDYRGEVIHREYLKHPGAVAVLALDDDDRVLLIRQYRHPQRAVEWELPAGLLDIAGESRLLAAQRELAEETGMAASEWMHLLDFAPTPGGSDEIVTIFLARGLVEVASDFVREGEEADIEVRWAGLDDVGDAALSGRLRNGILIGGVLAAMAARARDWAMLRPAEG